MLEAERGEHIDVSRTGKLDWTPVRESVKRYGMRNSNTMAMAPTATISNIVGSVPTIEPQYKNIFVKANMNGDFIVVNPYLVADLKALGLWDFQMIGLIKYHDGSVKDIPNIPLAIKEKYKEVFEIDPRWLIRSAAVRGKWVDQSQSLNIYFSGTSGRELAEIYDYAWSVGLKTTYYLRSLGASQVEKSTLDAKEFGATHKRKDGADTTAPIASVPSPIPNMTAPITASLIPSPIQMETVHVEAKVEAASVLTQSAPISIPTGTPKPVYNITRMPEATCDACQ
jgi:ribonucleoside-diphosphate reductase alpha chain